MELIVERDGDHVRVLHPGVYDQMISRDEAMGRVECILDRAKHQPPPIAKAMRANARALHRAAF